MHIFHSLIELALNYNLDHGQIHETLRKSLHK